MGSATDAVIALEAVSFTYDNIGWVLNKISLNVSKGERIAVLGHNGSGKSTLVRILGALQTPSQGACFVCGHNTSDNASFVDIHKKVSIVFQNPESQIVGAVVEDDVAFAPENQGLAPLEIEKRVVWALSKVGLLRKRSALVSALSGGEKQRLALAGALAAEAACLILDEPTAMLDPEGRFEVESVLRDIHASGTTILQVTHRLEDVRDANRVMVLSKGRWIWQGGREDFWNEAENLGFELPPLFALTRRLNFKGISVFEHSAEALAKAVLDAGIRANPFEGAEPSEASDGSPFFIDVRRLDYSFNLFTPLETKVLKDVSFAVRKGSWISLLGRTGSGKSTLIQHLNGLYKIQAGEIFVNGQPIPETGAELRSLRRSVGLVFQAPEDQLFSPTVREELSFAPLNWGFSQEETLRCVERAMEDVGLDESYLERNPLRLSGGERRLVAIASVLSGDPECIILDEPTAGLDVNYRKKILSLLLQLRAKGKTILTVTHDLDMAFDYSDHLILMQNGLRMCDGTVRATLPEFLKIQPRSTWPEVLQVSAWLRGQGMPVPLTWNLEVLCRVLDL